MSSLNYKQIWDSFCYALGFVPDTLILMFVPLLIGLVLGFVIAVIRIWHVPVFSKLLQAVLAVMKGLPVYLVLILANLLFILYFDFFAIHLGLSIRAADVNMIYLAVFLLTFCFLPGISELLRGGLLSVSNGQYEAGYAAGLTKVQTMRRIILPQMLPEIIPGLTGMMIAMLKASALAYCLGVTDIMNAAVRVATSAYDMLEGYIAAAIIYWGLSILIECAMNLLSKRVGHYQKQLKP